MDEKRYYIDLDAITTREASVNAQYSPVSC